MELLFSYDLQKDIENYKRASRSTNSRTPTEMETRYRAEYGSEFEDHKLEAFVSQLIVEQGLDLSIQTKLISAAWQPIEVEFFKRVELIFGISSPLDQIKVFLTTDSRCSYNIDHGYFFVCASRPFQNRTIMHELLHFWTWWKFHLEVESGRMTKECYNDVKESLTELLNVEFQDLLDGARDGGYPQHQKLRIVINKTWLKEKDINLVFEAASKFCHLSN